MSFFRPEVERLAGYMPGEQPQETGWLKLNTNENPYPPSPRVVEALERAIHGRLNVYPDPLGTAFRRIVAERFQVEPDWVLPANGSDENLTILIRSFVGPQDLVVYPYPSYILYETLVDLQGGQHARLPLNADWSWNRAACQPLVERAKLTIVPNPNSPSGTHWTAEELLALLPPRGLLVVDGAYADFADEPHKGEMLRGKDGERIILTRSLSKSYSLAGVRSGFAVAHPDLITGMRKMKDSYNCDSLSLAAAVAAFEDEATMLANAARIRATRSRLTQALAGLGFAVVPSQANFVWATHSAVTSRAIYEGLKARKILVRLMNYPDVPAAPGGAVIGLRITVGTNGEIDRLLEELRGLV